MTITNIENKSIPETQSNTYLKSKPKNTLENLTAKTIAEYILVGIIPREKIDYLSTEQQTLVKKEFNNLNRQLCVQMRPL